MKPIIFLDTETTGLKTPHVIELSYWKKDTGVCFTYRFKNPVRIEEDAIALHGITEVAVSGLKLFEENEEFASIKSTIENSVVIAHNAKFDIRALSLAGIKVDSFVDTQKIAKATFPFFKSYSLQSLRAELNLDTLFTIPAIPHSSQGDVVVMKALFDQICFTYMKLFEGADYDIMIEEFITNSQ